MSTTELDLTLKCRLHGSGKSILRIQVIRSLGSYILRRRLGECHFQIQSLLKRALAKASVNKRHRLDVKEVKKTEKKKEVQNMCVYCLTLINEKRGEIILLSIPDKGNNHKLTGRIKRQLFVFCFFSNESRSQLLNTFDVIFFFLWCPPFQDILRYFFFLSYDVQSSITPSIFFLCRSEFQDTFIFSLPMSLLLP